MAVRKRAGFKGVSSPKLTALKAQRDAANKRLVSANARIKAAEAKSKSANIRIKNAKRKIAKLKRKSSPRKSPQAHLTGVTRGKIHALSKPPKKTPKKTQRGVVKARGGGPASRPLSKVLSNSFMNPFPEAAAFQNPFTLGWRVVKGAKINPKTGRAHKTAHTEVTKTEGTVEMFEGGQPGIIGQPVGTGQYPISFVKTGDKLVKKVGKKKVFTVAASGDAAQSMKPTVFLKDEGGEDFAKAGAWWSDYTGIIAAGKVEKGGGQPGYGKGGIGPSEAQKDQPGWYLKPKDGKGEFKVTGPAGGYRVLSGKGKTKTWAGASSRLEAGAQPGGKHAFEKWFRFLSPEQQAQVKTTFKGESGLYKSTLDTDRGKYYGGGVKTTAPKVTAASLTKVIGALPSEKLAMGLKKMPAKVQEDVARFGYNNLSITNKQKLIGFANE